jgi:hypothetical protein
MLLNNDGLLDIDSIIVNNESYKKILEDGIITEEEVAEQSDKVVAMLHKIKEKYNNEQLSEIKELLAELSVLYAVYNFHSIQNINK